MLIWAPVQQKIKDINTKSKQCLFNPLYVKQHEHTDYAAAQQTKAHLSRLSVTLNKSEGDLFHMYD